MHFSPQLQVTWKRNGEYVNLDSRIHIQDGSLHIQKLFKEDEGLYQCIISNMAGRRESKTATLHVRREFNKISSISKASRII